MINENIINGLNSHEGSNTAPYYFYAIKGIEQRNECNQDSIIFTLYQINEPLESMSESIFFKKNFTITATTDLDADGLFSSKLIGYESKERIIENEGVQQDSHSIEVIETKLSKEIIINFSESLKRDEELPAVVITIDKEYKKLYSGYDTEFFDDNEGNLSGVKITFNNLKTRNSYPVIRIVIIGDSL